jgi:hypothetical protein
MWNGSCRQIDPMGSSQLVSLVFKRKGEVDILVNGLIIQQVRPLLESAIASTKLSKDFDG